MPRRTSDRTARPLLDVLIAALAVGVVALAAFVLLRDVTPEVSASARPSVPIPSASTSEPAAPESPAPTAPIAPTGSVAVLGDGTAAGERAWPQSLAQEAGLELSGVEAAPGSGYLTGTTFLDQAQALVSSGAVPQVLVVAGSRADATSTGRQVLDAATELYGFLGDELPQTEVVVVGPMWPTWAPPSGDPNGARQGVKSAAKAAGLTYVDPQEEPWFTDANRDLLDPGGARLTPAGAAYVAERLSAVVG